MHDQDPTPDSHHRHTRRGWRIGVLSAAALALHAAVLGGASWGWPAAPAVALSAPGMQVRVVETFAPVPVAVTSGVAERSAVVAALSRPEPPERHPSTKAGAARAAPLAPRVEAAGATPVSVREPVPEPMRQPMREALALPDAAGSDPITVAAATSASAAASASVSVPEDETIPHYRTRMPPPGTLRYEVSRGMLHGTADLLWRPRDDRYELSLDFKLSGLTILSQASSGAFDAAGLAPVRFTDQRLRRGTVAANFQRAADKITYSGTGREFPLRAGSQDRLSWMIQLAAIVAAEPKLARPGGKVVMYVTGANGDANVWVFRCVGPEPVEARGGTLDTIKFVREPRETNDTTVQVWLDPRQHDLPVRATQKSGPGDEGYELRLLEANLSR